MKTAIEDGFRHVDDARPRPVLQPALQIVSVYVLFGVVWFFLVDQTLARTVAAPHTLLLWTAVKPWGFVALTAVVLLFTLHRSLTRLHASEQRWKLLFDAAPDAYYLHDMSGIFLDGNRAAEDLTGYRKQELIGRSFMEFGLLAAEDAARAGELLERNRQGQPAGPTAYTLKRKDGTLASVEVRTLPVRVQNERVVVGIARDITERRRADEALLLSEQRFRSAMLHSPIGMAIVAPDGHWLDVNPALCKIVGYSPEELLATDFQSITHPDDLEADLQNVREMIERRRDTYRMDKRYIHKQGHTLWIQLNVSLVWGVDGTPRHFVAQVQDITERKRAEERLRQSEARFSAVFRASPTAIGISEFPDGPFVEVNDTFLDTFGLLRQEVIGHTSAELGLWCSQADRADLITSLRQSGCTQQKETKFRRKSGEVGDLLISAELMVVDGREYLLGMLLDITTRKHLEAQLFQAQKMEAIGQLAGGVAHDFNNILAAQLLHLQLLAQRDDLDLEIRTSLQELEQGIQRAASLTRQLLLFSRRQVMQVQPVEVDKLLAGLMKMLRRLLGEHILMTLTPSAEPVWVEADPGMLEQVIVNLCVNARDAMPGGGTLAIRTRLVTVEPKPLEPSPEARPGPFICVTVQDTGCGMDDATLKRVFEPFFTTKEPGKGTGLGLATVHGITKQHGGWVEVESALGRGTTFSVFLPAKTPPSVTPAGSLPTKVRGGTETILVVEDDEALRLMVRKTLAVFGYRVIEATSGTEAWSLWEARQPVHLLFTDMVMPGGLTGLDLAARIRQAQPTLKALVTSGYSSDLPLELGNLPPGVKFLPKPYTPSALASAVRASLDG